MKNRLDFNRLKTIQAPNSPLNIRHTQMHNP